MAYGESKVRRSHAPELWRTQPAIATILSTGRGEPRRALRDVGGETDRLEEDCKKQNTGGAEDGMAGRAPWGTARRFLSMRKSRHSQERSRIWHNEETPGILSEFTTYLHNKRIFSFLKKSEHLRKQSWAETRNVQRSWELSWYPWKFWGACWIQGAQTHLGGAMDQGGGVSELGFPKATGIVTVGEGEGGAATGEAQGF